MTGVVTVGAASRTAAVAALVCDTVAPFAVPVMTGVVTVMATAPVTVVSPAKRVPEPLMLTGAALLS